MVSPLQQQYYWNEFRRRQMLFHNISFKISRVAAAIVDGKHPEEDPEYQDDYCYLVGEFGEGVFQSEVNRLMLLKEEEEKRKQN